MDTAVVMTDPETGFKSRLSQGRQRFLAHALVHGLEIGRRTPDDFIRHFPPSLIMEGLADRPWLRANILTATVGIKKKVAAKKSATSAGEDLQIALDEGETDTATIVANFDPDDRVRYLDDKKLWLYITEGRFWEAGRSDKQGFERAKSHVAFMLERGLMDELLTHRDIVEGITVEKLCELLPRPELANVITTALEVSHRGKPFGELEFLQAIPPATLVEHVPLTLLWEHVVVSQLARAHGFVEKEPREDTGPNGGTAQASSPAGDGGSVPSDGTPTIRSSSAPAQESPPEAAREPSEPPASAGNGADPDGAGEPPDPMQQAFEAVEPPEIDVVDVSGDDDDPEGWEEETQRGLSIDEVKAAVRKAGRGRKRK